MLNDRTAGSPPSEAVLSSLPGCCYLTAGQASCCEHARQVAHCAGEGSGWRSGMGHHQRSLGAQPSDATGQVGTSFYISPGVRPLLVLLLQAGTTGAGDPHFSCDVRITHNHISKCLESSSAWRSTCCC